jgi:hypothetical protein
MALFADGSAPHSFKLTGSHVSSTGVLIGHYERDGEIKIVDSALDSPGKREIARQERMKARGLKFPRRNRMLLCRIDAELSAEPMPFDCERIVDSGVRRLITMEK